MKSIIIYKIRITLGIESVSCFKVFKKLLPFLWASQVTCLIEICLFFSFCYWEAMSQWASCSFVKSIYTLRMNAHPTSRWEWPGAIVVARAHWPIDCWNAQELYSQTLSSWVKEAWHSLSQAKGKRRNIDLSVFFNISESKIHVSILNQQN